VFGIRTGPVAAVPGKTLFETVAWQPWIDGYTEVLVRLEHGDAQAAIARYRDLR
jgi:hypothetical protein